MADPRSGRECLIAMLRDPSSKELATLAPVVQGIAAFVRKGGPFPQELQASQSAKPTPAQALRVAALSAQLKKIEGT